MFEMRLSLFGERFHAFFLIFRGEHPLEQAAFKADALCRAHFKRGVDDFLGHHRNRPALSGYFIGGL